jgi:hypothetical protein
MGNEHIYKLVRPVPATNEIKMLIKFMFYPPKEPSEDLKFLDYKWFYDVSDNFKLGGRFRSTHIEIENGFLIKFYCKATNSCFNEDMKRYISMLNLRPQIIQWEIEG